jgi:hypothetical protein
MQRARSLPGPCENVLVRNRTTGTAPRDPVWRSHLIVGEEEVRVSGAGASPRARGKEVCTVAQGHPCAI